MTSGTTAARNTAASSTAVRAATGKPIGLIMQGGGALGAYEHGAVCCLLDAGYDPVAVSGVSIGAINTAVIAGARGGDVRGGLQALWDAITLAPVPFWPADQQAAMSLFGNPGFWRSRTDFFSLHTWTSLCDVSPMYKTLNEIVDFATINTDPRVRMAVTATCVETGDSVRFSNHHPNAPGVPDQATRTVKKRTPIGPEHILASGSLPPGFPMTPISGQHYWDGGLFDNTPLHPLLEMLQGDEPDHLPIVVLDLFPSSAPPPGNWMAMQLRHLEITYQGRLWSEFGGPQDAVDFADMLMHLDARLDPNDPIRQHQQFKRMMLSRALRNLHVVENADVTITGGMDFSRHGVQRRRDDGYRMMSAHLDTHVGDLSRQHGHPSGG